jgi:addiction module HigA family antidote
MESLRDPKRRPTHPGAILREDVLPTLKMTQGDFAAHLGVSRLTVSELLNEKRGVSAEMALRLEAAIGSSAETWLRMQEAVDLWEARQDNPALAIRRIAATG